MAALAPWWPPRWRILQATLLLLALGILGACQRAPAEQQIRSSIDAVAMAARANDVQGVLAVVTDDFTGNAGDFDRQGLHRLLAVRALRQDRTGVLVGPLNFTRRGNRVIATFNLVLTGGRSGDLLPEQSAIYVMHTAWRRDGSHWRCYSATWSRKL